MQAHRLALLSVIVLYASSAAVPRVKDLDGREIDLLDDPTTVLIFTRTDCPVANRYAPELARIAKRTQDKGVRFFLVYVDPPQSIEAIRAQRREFDVQFEGLLDPQHRLVRFTNATTTPEVAVFKQQTLVYRGRIDNRQIDIATARRQPSVHDLDDVLTRILAGEPVKFRRTRAIGCFIEDVR